MKFHLTVRSENRKTGSMPVSTSDPKTCPKSCALYETCYAKGGTQLQWFWYGRMKRTGKPWNEFIQQVKSLPDNVLWRFSQAGDLPGLGEKINVRQMQQLIRANSRKKGFTFTHKPMTARNRALIKEANTRGFTVNLSANNATHADKLAHLKVGPVVCILPHDFEGRTAKTPEGRPIVRCPATYHGITCKQCGLCQVRTRSSIIGFPAHGRRKELINA